MCSELVEEGETEVEEQGDCFLDLCDRSGHDYIQSTDFDRLVNDQHNYYGRIEQNELIANVEHSYCFQLPETSTDQKPSEILDADEIGVNDPHSFVYGLASLEVRCEWEDCNWIGSDVKELSAHLDSHIPRAGDCLCRWKHCPHTRPYAKRYLLLRHIRGAHLDLRQFKCSHCSFSFRTKERLILHARAKHSGEAMEVTSLGSRYQCWECERSFITTSERRKHELRAHIKLRIMCRECDATFADSSSLLKHRKRKHNFKF